MAIFGGKIDFNQASQTAVQKARDLQEIARLNNSSSECEVKIRELYSKIGFETYKAYRDGVAPATEELLQEVAGLYQTIDANKARIKEINAANLCPGCGARIVKKSLFCSNCGYKFPVQQEQPVQQAQKFCPNCGDAMPADALFCSTCGTKVQ